jgi:hypothetical protein
MTKVHFRQTVVQQMPLLIEQGYQVTDAETGEAIRFRKIIVPGVEGIIQFHIKNFFVPPVRQFDVFLFRYWPHRLHPQEGHFARLALGLDHLLYSKYGINPFSVGQFMWQFTTRDELTVELYSIQEMLVAYAIPWLENSASTIDSVRGKQD